TRLDTRPSRVCLSVRRPVDTCCSAPPSRARLGALPKNSSSAGLTTSLPSETRTAELGRELPREGGPGRVHVPVALHAPGQAGRVPFERGRQVRQGGQELTDQHLDLAVEGGFAGVGPARPVQGAR